MKKYILYFAVFIILSTSQTGFGLSFEQVGPNSSRGLPVIAQPGEIKGIYQITNLESLVYLVDTNGNTNYYFKATVEEINEIINLFSKVVMRDHIVQIRSDKGVVKTFSGIEIGYNVKLQVVGGIVLSFVREEQREDLPLEPCLTIYTGDDDTIPVKLKWPENIIIENFVPESAIKSKIQKPLRDYYYGLLEFADGSPSVEFVSGVDSRITLWQQDANDGINIGKINNKGFFNILLSEEELTNLKTGTMWLTVTVSNSLTQAKKTDQKFPFEMLVKDKEKAKPVKVGGLPYYYGRLLFEDGSPAILDTSVWKGNEIFVDFSYAGMAHIDSEGYFKMYFTPEQYEKVKTQKVRNNIYVPIEINKGAAMYVFPVAELSQDKSKAGVVKIPRPKPPKQELSTVESKVGKKIPDFNNIQLTNFKKEDAKDKPLLVCFWDMDQRPSRQYVLELEKQKDTLKNKNIKVILIHAGTKTENEVKQWVEENMISFACGVVKGDSYDTLLSWGAKGLPWLVLTNEQHLITKAGFNIDELLLEK
jgi:hypothetical protein